jgi:protein disulfide-isomerase-like protein
MFVVAAAAFFLSLRAAAAAADETVVQLTAATFDAFVAAERATIIEVYAPWCGHCKRLKPDYESAAVALAADKLRLGALDATVHRELATKLGVRGYPTLIEYVGGKRVGERYTGKRTVEALVAHVRSLVPAIKDEL